MSLEAQQAYETKFCEEKKRPLAGKLVSELSSHVQPLFAVGRQQWKLYINQTIAIVQLEASRSNEALVYHAVSGYFHFLELASLYFTSGDVNNLIPECVNVYDKDALNSLIESDCA